MASNNEVFRAVAILGALLLGDKVLGLFAPENPGGDVDPAPEDANPATLSQTEADTLADQIEAAVWGTGVVESWTEDDEAFATCLMVPQNTADVRLLMNAYGSRGTHFNQLNLTETVVAYLDQDYRDAVRADYAAKGITIRF